MTALMWDQLTDKMYELGVRRGVLYVNNTGVPWNGLISVAESFDGGDVNAYYFDGIKHVNVVSPRAYKASITAFSAPREFGACVGEHNVVPGFIITRQRRERFGFSYQTLIGDGLGYKLHLVYNATATPGSKTYSTLGDTAFADSRTWSVSAVPEIIEHGIPSAHFVLDSRTVNPNALAHLEKILYGSTTSDPRLPQFLELLDFITYWAPFGIVPHTTTGLNNLTSPGNDVTQSARIGFLRRQAMTRLTESSVSGLYRLEV